MQTLPNATPPIGKITAFFEAIMQFVILLYSPYYDWPHTLKPFGLGGAVKPGEEEGHFITNA